MPDLNTRVADADTLVHLAPPTVREDDRLSDIVRSAASDPIARSAFVVDERGRLVGVTAVSELDRDMLMLVIPGSGAERLGGRQLARLAHGTDVTARQLMREPATVRLTDTLATAVQRMEDHQLESVAVLDDEGRFLGYVAIFEILAELILGPAAVGQG